MVGPSGETPTLPDLPNEVRKEILRRDFDSAIVVLNDALRSNPDDGALLAMRGRARLELGFYSEASDDFAAAYRHDPSINSATFAAYCTAKLNRYSYCYGMVSHRRCRAIWTLCRFETITATFC